MNTLIKQTNKHYLQNGIFLYINKLYRYIKNIFRKKTKPVQHGVVMTIYKESFKQIETSLLSIKKHEPLFPVTVISDGTERFDIKKLTQSLGYNYIQSDHLKLLEKGALWWKRTLTKGLELKTDFILKMDPDALFARPFKEGPQGDYYGSIQGKSPLLSIQGGCQGISRKFAKQILASKITEDPLFSDPVVWSPENNNEEIFKKNYLSTDWTLAYVARKLKVKPVIWDEIKSNWKETPSNTKLQYAVTHPHKLD